MSIFEVLNNARDVRTDGYVMAKSNLTPVIILTTYYLLVKKIGPAFMRNRNAYDLRWLMLVYNALQIFANITFFISFAKTYGLININCEPIDKSTDPEGMHKVHLIYLYYVLKLSDMIETIFFVLRKKYNQVSVLHLYHHIGMVLYSWVFFKFYPGGVIVWLGYANALVHIIMYLYYFLTALDNSYSKSYWWKRHVTEIQILQHYFVTYCFSAPLFTPNCTYPKLATYLLIPNCLGMIGFFTHFYYKHYLAKELNKAKKSTKAVQ